MSFSFQSMFQGSADTGQQGAAAALDAPTPMTSVSAPPLNAVSPFGAPLFKFASGESHAATPVQHSPFSTSTSPSAGTGSPLTVGDGDRVEVVGGDPRLDRG